jgi:hypothetical protein
MNEGMVAISCKEIWQEEKADLVEGGCVWLAKFRSARFISSTSKKLNMPFFQGHL